MTQVRDLQPAMAEVIRRHESRIVFYYAAYDRVLLPSQGFPLFPHPVVVLVGIFPF